MAPIKCCVLGCSSTNRNTRLYYLPKDDKLRALWLSFLVPMNPELIFLSKEQLLNKRVCLKHFDRFQLDDQGNRLKDGYPCLFSDKEILHGIPLDDSEADHASDHNYCSIEAVEAQEISQSSVTIKGTPEDHMYLRGATSHTTALLPKAGLTPMLMELPSTSYSMKQSDNNDDELLGLAPKVKELPSTTQFVKQSDNCDDVLKGLAPELMELPSTTQFVKQSDNCDDVLKGLTPIQIEIPSSSHCVEKSDNNNAEFKGIQMQPCRLKRKPYDRNVKAVKFTTEKLSSKNKCFSEKVKKIATTQSKTSKNSYFAERYASAKALSEDRDFAKNIDRMSQASKTLLLMQLRTIGRNKKAIRFTMQEKILSLSLMKESPKGYRFLQKIFHLPSKRTLNRLAENVTFGTGMNMPIFHLIKKKTMNWNIKKKLCSVVFDEVALTPHLTFVESRDKIEGFVDTGSKIYKYCDHALVFMVRGICDSWRQPVCYYFCEGTIPAETLMNILRELIFNLKNSGLEPITLVCDQGQTFRKAMKLLKLDTNRQRFLDDQHSDDTVVISGQTLYIVFDPPHLLKSIRNNFLTKDMVFEGKVASWNDILTIFNMDSQVGHTRMLPRLTEQHVVAEKIKKMKVSIAAQVLSARTASMLQFAASFGTFKSGEEVSKTMETTGDAVAFFDRLFDSTNGSLGTMCRGKLRGPVTHKSAHIEFWHEALRIIDGIRFVDSNSKRAIKNKKKQLVKVPCLEGWRQTIKSFIGITKLLLDNYNVKYFYTRNVNQDPLENFFGRVRALNYRNVNPDAYTFVNTFKSLLISNIMGPHSIHSNCQDDPGETLIDFFNFNENKNNLPYENIPSTSSGSQLMSTKKEYNVDKENVPPNYQNLSTSRGLQVEHKSTAKSDLFNQTMKEKVRVHSAAYTAGYICRKLKKIGCHKCIKTFTTKNVGSIHTWITFREYKTLKHSNLVYPTEAFLILYRNSAEIIHNVLNGYAHQNNIGSKIKEHIITSTDMTWFGCPNHASIIQNGFLKLILRIHVHSWCNNINRIFNGKISPKHVAQMQYPQKLALEKYKSTKCKKRK